MRLLHRLGERRLEEMVRNVKGPATHCKELDLGL